MELVKEGEAENTKSMKRPVHNTGSVYSQLSRKLLSLCNADFYILNYNARSQ